MQILPLGLSRKLDIDPRSILVFVGEGLLGDAVMRLPFASALRRGFPEAEITWAFRRKATASGQRIRPLLAAFCDEILLDVAIGDSPLDLLKPRPYPDRRWDLLIDTQRVVPRAASIARFRHKRYASFAGRYLLSDVKPRYSIGRSVKVRHYGRQLMSLLSVIETGSPDKAQSFTPAPLCLPPEIERWAAAANQDGAVMIAPGAGGRSKCWPLERIVTLAGNLARAGKRVAFLLGPAEVEWHATLAEGVPEASFPLSDMPEAIRSQEPLATLALARHAAVTLAMDSGVGHLLASQSPKHCVLFGPTTPRTFEPAARCLKIITAQQFGGDTMSAIPEEPVRLDILEWLATSESTQASAASKGGSQIL